MLRQDREWVMYEPPAPAVRSAWALAERYEALLRVFNDPAAYAARLARRLHGNVKRVLEVMRVEADAASHCSAIAPAGDHALERWRPFFNSS